LLLTKFDKENIQSIYEEVRIDEVIFEAFEAVKKVILILNWISYYRRNF
jgi:phosphosulfolactate synthase (CoM biosynthesis protein A)